MFDDLPLFAADVRVRRRYADALAALDLDAATADCPPADRDALDRLRAAATGSLDALKGARPGPQSAELARTWVRMVGRRLDGTGIPGVLDGVPAAEWLRRGGEVDRGRRSLARHLRAHPADRAGWEVAVAFGVRLAALHLAFHGGPVLAEAEPWIEAADADGSAEPTHWVFVHAWLAGTARVADLERALAARRIARPLPLAGDGVAFTWYLVETLGVRSASLLDLGTDLIEARRRLRAIQPVVFARVLARTGP